MGLKEDSVVDRTRVYVYTALEGGESGHDKYHIERVFNNAEKISDKEGGNKYVIRLSALLHDIADHKFHGGDFSVGAKVSRTYLESLGVESSIVNHVCEIVDGVSFKGLGSEKPARTIEGRIVRDADRLDALGAIGIARCFTYGGYRGLPMHIPGVEPVMHQTPEEYSQCNSSQINHFYEKLLHLKDLMTTKTGREMAEERHRFMDEFLNRFLKEWDGLI